MERDEAAEHGLAPIPDQVDVPLSGNEHASHVLRRKLCERIRAQNATLSAPLSLRISRASSGVATSMPRLSMIRRAVRT